MTNSPDNAISVEVAKTMWTHAAIRLSEVPDGVYSSTTIICNLVIEAVKLQ